MATYGGPSSSATTSTNPLASTPDIEVADPPSDSISCLAWSPQADFLAAGSWDNQVRIYEVAPGGQTQGRAMFPHEAPVLSVCWSTDGSKVFGAGADHAARMLDIQANPNQAQQIAQHDAPIKAVKYVDTPQGPILVTGSWDKTVKYWDLRTPAPIATVQLPERCYSLDVVYPLMVVGCASRHVQIYNLTNPTTLYKAMESPFTHTTRVVTCVPEADGFALGSVEGRVALQYVEAKDESRNFTYKCHRRSPESGLSVSLVYAINDMKFHPVHGTMSTAGGDGGMYFWDTQSRRRLKEFGVQPGPVACTAFNASGSIFAYAVAYDWWKGYKGMTATHPNKIMLHACKEDEVKKRPAVPVVTR